MQEGHSAAAKALDRVRAVREAMPGEGLFQDKEWHLSPAPFALPSTVARALETLGRDLADFTDACNRLYFESAEGGRLGWVAALLDAGKPDWVVALGRDPRFREAVPRVIRPDIILTADGFTITELDSLPGGIGLTGWLNATYAKLGWDVIGGEAGMIEGFAGVAGGGDIVISRESADYKPEMQWMARAIAERGLGAGPGGGDGPRVVETAAWDESDFRDRCYRFFELWDYKEVECYDAIMAKARAGDVAMSPPPKAFLEEKLWLSLFWSPGLAEFWEEALDAEVLGTLRRHLPMGWVLDPEPLPYFAEYPQLGIHDWSELESLSQTRRQFALKISGFSEKSWGSRGVHIGHDLSQAEWKAALDAAMAGFGTHPHVLQAFHTGKRVLHPYYDAAREGIAEMDGRVRLSPYYFRSENGNTVRLGGVLATICPADKKIIHGMKDAVIVPCREAAEWGG